MENIIKVLRNPIIDSFGKAVCSESGKQMYEYEVQGELFGRTVRARMDVVAGKDNKGDRAGAYELLDIVFGACGNFDFELKQFDTSFTDAAGKTTKRYGYKVIAIEPDTGYPFELPMKPRAVTDTTILENLYGKQRFLAQKAAEAAKAAAKGSDSDQ